MKVQELYDLMDRGKAVIIKPGGRRIYFEGTSDAIPECMLQLSVMEIQPVILENVSALSIMVKPTAELNALVDCGVSSFSKVEIDNTFNELIKERGIRSGREEKRTLPESFSTISFDASDENTVSEEIPEQES